MPSQNRYDSNYPQQAPPRSAMEDKQPAPSPLAAGEDTVSLLPGESQPEYMERQARIAKERRQQVEAEAERSRLENARAKQREIEARLGPGRPS